MSDFQPVDLVDQLNGGSPQSQQLLSIAAATVYGHAYNAERERGAGPVGARDMARAAAQDFLNMEFKRV